MTHDRLVPFIVAVALFMDNMDSTVIATSLPAIAADIGTSPLTLKLAVTSYLLSLAVFIPMSGWTADRFGARTVFRAAIAVFVLGSIGCALSGSLAHFVVARIVQGMGGAMMTPVGRLVLVRTIDRRELVNAMAWVSIPAMIGPLMGPPLGGFITTYATWHWIFLINVPMGLLGIVLVTRYIENIKAEVPERFDFAGMVLSGTAVAGLTFGMSVAGFDIVPWPIVAADHRRRSDRARILHRLCAAGAGAGARFQPAETADVPGEPRRRLPVPHRRRRHAVPAAAAAPGRLQAVAVPVRPDHVHLDHGRAVS